MLFNFPDGMYTRMRAMFAQAEYVARSAKEYAPAEVDVLLDSIADRAHQLGADVLTAYQWKPTTTGYSIEQLIADAGGWNDGTLCPPVDTYDWGRKGDGCTDRDPPDNQLVTSWWTAQWTSCGDSAPGVVLYIRNFKSLAWYGGTDWRQLPGDWNQWEGGTYNPDTGTGYGPSTKVPGGVVMPEGQRSLHGGTFRLNHNAARGIVTVFEAKYSGSKPIMVNAGADHVEGEGIQPRLFVSKYKRLRSDIWTPIGGSSVSEANLRAFPPPLGV